MNSLQRLILAMLCLLVHTSVWPDNLARLQMGFLVNFVRYVEWPEPALKPGQALRLCLTSGGEEINREFGELQKLSLTGRAIVTRVLQRPSDVTGCHALYLTSEASTPLSAWLAAARQPGLLLVGDVPDLVDTGGMIGLVPVAGRYRFDINLGQALQVDLRIGSQLLKLARVVK